ncbi:MAG: hypothetical protein CML02_03200 [Pseudooceanicola sp.]|jgi:hypothetical protein|nr:hypothetical protein [Pseudooceanicola sp.]|tara:strand:+ start:536 stop:1051 length:516 start_codon:yes stop_codon:yes gene_type:complete
MVARYNLHTNWKARADCEEVCDILFDDLSFPTWWKGVILDVTPLARGDDFGVGRRAAFRAKLKWPATVQWVSEVTKADLPHRWTIRARGDVAGRGEWILRQNGGVADIENRWAFEFGKPGLRRLSPLIWPIVQSNYRWAMARGLDGLGAELTERREKAAREVAARSVLEDD